jgi:hypothetical protein
VTVPKRAEIRFVVKRIVKVVLRLVTLRAAPIANACKEVAPTSLFRIKDRPIGALILVIVT